MKTKSKKILLFSLPYIVIFFVITILLNYQLINHATIITSDAWVHFNRFYDSSMQLKTGNLSYFQTNYGFNHSGRIFNALYGPLFAYLNGLLLLICKNWFTFQIVIDYIVMMIAGMGMYYLGRKVKVNQVIALLLATIYLQLGITVGILRFNWMSWGAAIAPFVMIQAVNMVEDKVRPIHWLILAILMSTLAQIHLLSTVILAVTLIPFFIYCVVISKNKKQIFIDLGKALLLTLLLTANIWGAFLLLYPTNMISLPRIFDLNESALHVSRFISLHEYISYSILALIIFQVIYIAFNFKKSTINTISTIVALVFLVVSSRIFPWTFIQQIFPKLGASFQFPYRLMVGAYPLLLMSVGISLNQLVKKYHEVAKYYTIFALMLILLHNFSFNLTSIYRNTNNFIDEEQVVEMNNYCMITADKEDIKSSARYSNDGKLFELVSHVEPDYLPVKKHHVSNSYYLRGVMKQNYKYLYQVDGNKLILTWNSKDSKNIYLPVVMYHQSRLIVNGNNVSDCHKNVINQPLIKTKKGLNKATLQFITPIWFKILLVITIISWLALAGYGIKRLIDLKDKKKFNEQNE